MSGSPIFSPYSLKGLGLRNRIAMAPMTRSLSPGGVPGDDVARYYERRAAHGVGLVITEGTWIDHPVAANDEQVPRFHGADALAGWKRVVDAVHAAGGAIIPQLWHVGQTTKPAIDGVFDAPQQLYHPDVVGPSGLIGGIGQPMRPLGRPMAQGDIDAVIDAYARAAVAARDIGCDGVELHAAHGYLIDQFLWDETNLRTDRYGGDIARRVTFAAEVVSEMRRRAGADFPIVFRFSQWKSQDYSARIAQTPQELERILVPLADAGVDVFHASQRRFWEPAFAGSDLNLAGWAKKLSGAASITVGSVGLDGDFLDSLTAGAAGAPALTHIARLERMIGDGEVDLVAVGRALLADPRWAEKLQAERLHGVGEPFTPFTVDRLAALD